MSLTAKEHSSRGIYRDAGRAGSVLAGCTVLVHLAAAAPGSGSSTTMLAMHLAMAAACLPCVVCLWHRPGPAAWAMSLATGGAMIVAHLLMMAPVVVTGSGHHGSTAEGSVDVVAACALGVAVLEVCTAAWVMAVASMEREM